MTRIFFASLFGCIAAFIWTHLAYTSLRIGNTGLQKLPNETAVLGALRSNIAEKSGVYIFPSLRLELNSPAAGNDIVTEKLAEKVARYPSGILMYNAAGSRPIERLRWLSIEFLTELVEAFTAVFLLSCTRLRTYLARVGFILLIGVIAAIATNVPHWNWYGFSASYILPYMLIQLVGFLCLSVVAAFVLKGRSLVLSKIRQLQQAYRALLSIDNDSRVPDMRGLKSRGGENRTIRYHSPLDFSEITKA